MARQKMTLFAASASLALLFAAGCASSPTDSDQDDTTAGGDVEMSELTGTEWTSKESGDPFLEFADDGTYTGSDGCNKLRGEYTVDGSTISLSAGLSTLKGCAGVDTWLFHASTIEVDADALEVFDAHGERIGELRADG